MRNRNLVVVLMALLGASAGWADPVANPGFETGDFTGWTLGGACTGVSPTSNGPCWSDVVNSTPYGLVEGSYSGKFGAQPDPMTISQSITIPAADYYEVSFWMALTTGNPKGYAGSGNPLFDPANFLRVSWGGVQVGDLHDLDAAGWARYSFPITSTGAPMTLEFEIRQDNTGDFFLDDISIDIPEPATLALIGLGLACLALIRRRG